MAMARLRVQSQPLSSLYQFHDHTADVVMFSLCFFFFPLRVCSCAQGMLEECGKSILFSFALLVSYIHSVPHSGGSETSHQCHGNQEMTELMETQVHIIAACPCLSSCTVHLAQ